MLPLEINMEKPNKQVFDLERCGHIERPMGARLPRSMHEVYHYGRLIGMSDSAAKLYAKRIAGYGLGISQEALAKAETQWREEQDVLEQRALAVAMRAEQAARRSPNTKSAIQSSERRRLQKIASRKRK